ncbi:(-)-germacrene D synthase [Apostasia shenzhenica]|uniref:(-)-germacrene D synthase n=1 Tax=Apostasia shenzhenica TaxID=1088818 RepID=A0A2I0AH28_9ASPA|nr:(-)-germacrene D synthase [Apostasia shenzhenica]
MPLHPQGSDRSEDSIRQRVDELRKEVKDMLLNGDEITNLKVKIELIGAIERLGVDYHFEEEIEGLLKRIYDHGLIDADDLYSVSLQFRLLRQHGYNITSGNIITQLMT